MGNGACLLHPTPRKNHSPPDPWEPAAVHVPMMAACFDAKETA